VNDCGAPAGAEASLIFIPGAFAARLIYDAAAAAKNEKRLAGMTAPCR
jgi:succinyl-CoA synthetase alpha subunit